MLAARESESAFDSHVEHIYANIRPEDEQRFSVEGSIRCYFDDFCEYAEHYTDIDSILMLNISEVYGEEESGRMITGMGMEYCLLYWVMHYAGRLLWLCTVVIGIIVMCSVLYIFRFYYHRNVRYYTMLQNIGMEKRDRVGILSIEICAMLLAAAVLGSYISAVFLMLLNIITKQALNFNIILIP